MSFFHLMKQGVVTRVFIVLLLLISFLNPSYADDHSFEFSGFGRLVAGAIDEPGVSFAGYDEDFSFTEQSLIALRADYSYSDNLSIVAQVLGHSGEARKSGVQWLYLQYQATNNLSFKLGRQRIPFFTYSDVIDVGFAYDWISPPIQVYTNYVFADFDGVTSQYNFASSSLSGSLTGYYGIFDGELVVSGERRNADVQKTFGLAGELSWHNFTFSAAVHSGSVTIVNDELNGFQAILRQFNFNRSADSLDIDGDATFFKLGLMYEDYSYFVRSELTKIESDITFVPTVEAGYVSAGYRFPHFLIHGTIATSQANYGDFPNEIPLGLNPQLDGLNFGYQQIINALPLDSLDSVSIGLRYDYSTNVALKAEVSFLDGERGERAFFDRIDLATQKPEAVLYQFAVEWIF